MIIGPYPEEDGEGNLWGWGASDVTGYYTVGPTIGEGTVWGWGSNYGSGYGWTSGATVYGQVTSVSEGGTATLTISSSYGGTVTASNSITDISTYRHQQSTGKVTSARHTMAAKASSWCPAAAFFTIIVRQAGE